VKIALVVEYNGRRYHGFEWQNGLPTVQSELEKAINLITGETRRVIAASRTDAGVHARGQVVSFWTDSRLPPATIQRALNANLPEDIAVLSAHQIPENFSVRSNAILRHYDYFILNRSCRSPIAQEYTYFISRQLDVETMNKACRFLVGRHDFTSFITSWESDRDPVRNVHQAVVERNGETVVFSISANSFLTHQVRNTVGLLVRIGLGKLEPEELEKLMELRRPGLAGPTAPAKGLCLTRIEYERPLGE
jgi:tRNA pseudouridine38-40 synthase